MVKLISKFKPLYTNNTRYFVLTGGRGSSKSFHVADFLLKLSYEQGHNILFTRYTMISAGLSVIPEFTDKIDRYNVHESFKVNQSDITNTLSDSKIIFKGIKTSSGNQTAALKSLQGVSTFILDEAEELLDENIFDKIDESVREKDVQNRVILILNPTVKDHWIFKRFFEQPQVEPGFNGVHGDTTYIHTTYLDNLNNLNESIISKFEKLKEKHPKKYEHRVMGGWLDEAEGLIFENYSIIPNLPDEAELIGYGLDFGFSSDPAALVAAYRYDGQVIFDEMIYQTHLTNSELIHLMKSKGVDIYQTVWADSAEPKTIEEISRAGFNIKPVVKGSDSIRAGIRIVNDIEHMAVTKRSINLLKELRMYCYDTDKNGKPIDKPVDNWNHCFVYDTQISTPKGNKKIGLIQEGDYVNTPNGVKRVLKKWDNGIKRIRHYSMRFDTFSLSLDSTKDHKVKVSDEWKQISKLKKGDKIYLRKSLMEKHIISTQMNAISQKAEKGFIGLFGNTIMEKSQKAIIFIMLMKIPTTIIFKTLTLLAKIYILGIQVKNVLKTILNGLKSFIKKELNQLKNGISRKKEGNGIQNTVKKVGLIARFIERIVLFAVRHTKHTYQQEVNTATIIVKLKRLEIGQKRNEFVFDLMVEDEHCYYANGVLVHNCIDALRYLSMMELKAEDDFFVI